MARAILSLLAVVFSLLYISGKAESSAAGATSFIKAKCSATTYPSLCIESLSVYAVTIQNSPLQLVRTALSVSLQRAETTKAFVSKLKKFKGLKSREHQAIKDCFEEISDDVDRLSKSVKELKNIGQERGEDFTWHLSNVETWVSAALTDDNTCMDGFSEKGMNGRIKASIRARMTNVAQVTSNALALVNQYAATH